MSCVLATLLQTQSRKAKSGHTSLLRVYWIPNMRPRIGGLPSHVRIYATINSFRSAFVNWGPISAQCGCSFRSSGVGVGRKAPSIHKIRAHKFVMTSTSCLMKFGNTICLRSLRLVSFSPGCDPPLTQEHPNYINNQPFLAPVVRVFPGGCVWDKVCLHPFKIPKAEFVLDF